MDTSDAGPKMFDAGRATVDEHPASSSDPQDRDRPRRINGDAAVAAFPLGGIGTGNVSIGARGEFRDWEIFNGPGKGAKLPFTFFAIRAAAHGGVPVTRVLESRLRAPHERADGYEPGDIAGLPRLRESHLRGEYPFAWVEFSDDELPVSVGMEAFTPLVPLNAAESGIPAAVLRYRVRNVAQTPVDVTVVGSLFNAVGFDGFTEGLVLPRLVGEPSNEFRDDGVLRGLRFGSSLPADDLKHGTMALLTSSARVTVKPDWPAYWPAFEHGIEDFWSDLCDDGMLDRGASRESHTLGLDALAAAAANPALAQHLLGVAAEAKRHHVGSLGVTDTLAPGRERTFEFILAWHFPNRSRAWNYPTIDDSNANQRVANFYAQRYGDAWEVGRHLQENLPQLERATRDFHDSLFGSGLPAELVDAAASNVATLRSTTCFWLEDGTFAGWEGAFDRGGSCPGSCTHVWNYAQTAAFLFPELERSMRRAEFNLETDADGRMNFRTNRIFGGAPWLHPPAVDGQLGTIVRLYREWKFSGDDGFLADLWPSAARALEFAFTEWDSDGDFVLDACQHNTYDVEFHGPNSHASALFYAALRAGAEMAEHLGENARAERYRRAAANGAEAMDRLLWNGEYYVQRVADVDAVPYQYGAGCLSDQVFGQLLAHVVGLGYVLPRAHVREALVAIHRYNFIPELRLHENGLRTFALGDEAGLVLCTWPHGGRPRRPFYFCDEVWSGVEYQVAAHLIYEGLVDEGLEIVRAVRARHDGYRRSPWNEGECGHHYVRSMASWALLVAFSGFRYDATTHAIGFAPATADPDFRCFFSSGNGWGTFTRDGTGACLHLLYGTLELSRFDPGPTPALTAATAAVNGRRVQMRADLDDGRRGVEFEQLELAAGDVLRIQLAAVDGIAAPAPSALVETTQTHSLPTPPRPRRSA